MTRDGGSAHYAAAIRAISGAILERAVEALTPDFQGVMRDVQHRPRFGVGCVRADVETVRRLTHPVRDPRAGLRANHRRAACGEGSSSIGC